MLVNNGVSVIVIWYTDPYLTSQYAIQFARGVQEGEDTRYNTVDHGYSCIT